MKKAVDFFFPENGRAGGQQTYIYIYICIHTYTHTYAYATHTYPSYPSFSVENYSLFSETSFRKEGIDSPHEGFKDVDEHQWSLCP